MISLSQFRSNILPIFRLVIKTGMYVDVYYKQQAYRIHVENLHQHVPQVHPARHRSLVGEVQTEKCPDCKKLMLNGVCMNSLCPSASAVSQK